MPVAKGAGYVLSSVNQKKKLKQKESLSGSTGDAQSLWDRNGTLTSTSRRERRRARGCRHCRRNHDITNLPLECKVNTCIKCIGCEKILVANVTDLNGYPPQLTVRSCCADFKGKLSKVFCLFT